MVRISNDNIFSSYPDDDDYDDEGGSDYVVFSGFLTIFFSISLSCTIGSLLCDIPVIIIQFVSTKVMNNIVF